MKQKAPRNKTLELDSEEEKKYASKAVELKEKASLSKIKNRIILGDSLNAMEFMPEASIDLMIVDPPYNLTKNYAGRTFKKRDFDEYCAWLDEWLMKSDRLLKPNASIYICSDWQTSIAIPLVAQKYFILRNRISWEREKGRASSKNWKNCLEDIWFFTKGSDYVFNLDNVKMQRKVIAPYREKSGKPKDWTEENGQKVRLTAPSNCWTDITIPFWSMPENTDHPTQKPEKLIAKLVLASSRPGDIVLDPFVGSGTTCVVAKKLGRHYLGIEIDEEYCLWAAKRLTRADKDLEIQGYNGGFFWERNTLNPQKKSTSVKHPRPEEYNQTLSG